MLEISRGGAFAIALPCGIVDFFDPGKEKWIPRRRARTRRHISWGSFYRLDVKEVAIVSQRIRRLHKG